MDANVFKLSESLLVMLLISELVALLLKKFAEAFYFSMSTLFIVTFSEASETV